MAQSITRRLKRGNLFAVWNNELTKFQFYRKLKSGYYRMTLNPYSNSHQYDTGMHYTHEHLYKMNEKGEKERDAKKPNFLQKIFGMGKK